ncbi:MAG: YggT family protein [Clostridia bacterium]|nr:YggT family protein [Clostridia bacterium]
MVADAILYFIQQFVLIFIDIIDIALLVRAILGWFDPMREWRISEILYVVTEPIILPVRRLCERMNWFQGVPLDVPFMITWLLLMVIQMLFTAL